MKVLIVLVALVGLVAARATTNNKKTNAGTLKLLRLLAEVMMEKTDVEARHQAVDVRSIYRCSVTDGDIELYNQVVIDADPCYYASGDYRDCWFHNYIESYPSGVKVPGSDKWVEKGTVASWSPLDGWYEVKGCRVVGNGSTVEVDLGSYDSCESRYCEIAGSNTMTCEKKKPDVASSDSGNDDNTDDTGGTSANELPGGNSNNQPDPSNDLPGGDPLDLLAYLQVLFPDHFPQ